MKLSQYALGRDNNFNLIRILAALAVLVTHSFTLATGNPDLEPLRGWLGITMGTIAVDIFFITSGFLVTASLLNRRSIVEFAWARVLRIFPALLAMLALTVFVLGPFLTTLPVTTYLTRFGTYTYLVRCAVLLRGIGLFLPGVFTANPYKGTVNGSLWTMPFEIKMYVLLALLWLPAHFVNRDRQTIFKAAVLAFLGATVIVMVTPRFHYQAEGSPVKFYFMFFCGAAFYVMKDRIPVRGLLFWPLLAGVLITAIFSPRAFTVVYPASIAYLLFYLAYVPAGMIRRYNTLGDYSYGVYIYAFPVQQSVAALVPGISILSLLAVSALVTLGLAVLSWHGIEHRCLSRKAAGVEWTRRIIQRYRPADRVAT